MFVLLPRSKWLSFSDASLYCAKNPASSELIWWSPANPCTTLQRRVLCPWDRQEVRQHALPHQLPSTVSLILTVFATLPIYSAEELRSLTCYHQFIFPVSRDLALAKWELSWSTVIVYLIQKLPRRPLELLFSEDKVNVEVITYLAVIVASL